jgi:hypothetical protein
VPRWEWRPGGTLFFVWQQDCSVLSRCWRPSSGVASSARSMPGRTCWTCLARPLDVPMVKMTDRLNPRADARRCDGAARALPMETGSAFLVHVKGVQ